MTQVAPEHPLRKWRKRQGWTLEKAASEVGTSRQVWSDWERGRRRPDGRFMPKVRDLTLGEITADTFFPSLDKAA